MRAATTAAATTATASTAAGLGDVVCGGDAAEFEGHADVFSDFLLEALQLLLGGEKFAGDVVFEESLAGGLELADFRGSEFHAGVLLVMQFLAALVDALILKPRGIIVEEALHTLLELQKRRVAGDLGAQFLGFHDDGGFFCSNGHAG